jgi:hypothetical protein
MTHEQPLDLPQLLENFEEHYPKSWHEDKWYLTAVSSLSPRLQRRFPVLTKRQDWFSDR